jgi:hypothetical protein
VPSSKVTVTSGSSVTCGKTESGTVGRAADAGTATTAADARATDTVAAAVAEVRRIRELNVMT